MAKFLVNKISDDGLTGETTQIKTIVHNLVIIGHDYYEGFMNMVKESNLPYIIQICVIGRYVAYIELRNDMKEGVMRFHDLLNDDDLALDAAKILNEKWFSAFYFRWFMEVFEMLKPVYSDNYDAAELVLTENAGIVLN
jgi:hypothetical protein